MPVKSKPDFGPPPAPAFEIAPRSEEIAFFQANGYLAVERLTSDEELAWLRQIVDYIFDPANASAPGAPLDRSGALKAGEESRLSQSFFPEMRFPQILNSAFHRNAKRYAAALLAVEESRLSCWGHMIRKPAGGRDVPWHQDHAYWQPELDYYALGVWLPLHDVTVEMGAMQFIPGSHRLGLVPHRHDEAPAHNVLTVAETIDASAAVACPLKAGGATFHHSETLHFTPPNATQTPRLAFPMEFQLKPVRREAPAVMPWVDEHRAAVGNHPLTWVADGKISVL
ncbi:MAG: phytanoyl-CoA dioxygenase family protein [Caulobacterales bacterium]